MMTAEKRRRSDPRRQQATRSVLPLAEDLARAHGLVVWDVSFTRQAGQDSLRVLVDRVGGVSASELGQYSEQLSREIDRADAVPGDQGYVLEVSSPGAERRLTDPDQFRVCVGRMAKVSLRDGRVVEGPIRDVTDRAVEIGDEDSAVRALFDDIAEARLVVKL